MNVELLKTSKIMDNDFKSLIYPRTVAEHRSAYLFSQFCDYTLAANGEVLNLAKPGLASLYYHHLVHWFNTVGRTFFPEINGYDSAQLTLYVNTGISEPDDLKKLFSDECVGQFTRPGDTPAFCIKDEPTETTEPTVEITTVLPDKPETMEQADELDDGDVNIDRKKPDHKVRYKGVTRRRHQHDDIIVPRGIKEYSLKISGKTEYFVLHSGPDTEIICYPVEDGKTLKDYSQKNGMSASWGCPYLLALRADYVKRTGCSILDVRKVAYPNWVKTWRAKYLKQTRLYKKELKQQNKKV